MDIQRLILVVALSMILLLLWQAWEQERNPIRPPTPIGDPTQPGVPATPDAPKTPAVAPTPGLESAQRITVKTDLLEMEIDALGGDVRRLSLLQYPVEVNRPDSPFRLLNDTGPDLFVVQSGLIGNDGPYPNHKSRYTTPRDRYTLADGQDQLEVSLSWAEAGLRVQKVYTFYRNSYAMDVHYVIENTGPKAREPYLYAQLLRTHVAQGGYFNIVPSYTGGAIYTPENKYEKIGFDDMVDAPLARDVKNGWVAMLQHYFVGAIVPGDDAHQFYSATQPGARYVLGYKTLNPTPVNAGESARLRSSYYLGPKEQERLEQQAPGLILTVDYGWLTVVSAPLFWVLDRIHTWVGNWGWAIVILTLLIKLAFYPLSAASYRSMANMRKLQPRLMTLKERYGDDRQKMNQAMMELYRTEKINPLGGCLPILVQIPVFIALYWVLLESVELRHAPFILWINDLSSPDPYFVLPIVMGVTMVLQQMLNPAPLEPLQKKIMMALPVLFTVFFLFFASGLVLYWAVNNILSIAQQWWITRKVEAQTK